MASYALISDHNGPCSAIGEYDSLAAAIDAARTMDTDAAPTDLEDALDYDATPLVNQGRGSDAVAALIALAEAQGWRVVASAAQRHAWDEYWTVLQEVA